MIPDWAVEIKSRMFAGKITNQEIADYVGVRATYISTVLNGNKKLTEQGLASLKGRILDALEKIEQAREESAKIPDEDTAYDEP